MKVIKWLDEHFEETFLVFFLVLISCITMLQIIARTFFAALSWPEEFCRYCWIWSVFISLPYTMRKGNMLRVNVLVDLLPTKARNAINIVIDLINTVVMALFFNGSITVIQKSSIVTVTLSIGKFALMMRLTSLIIASVALGK